MGRERVREPSLFYCAGYKMNANYSVGGNAVSYQGILSESINPAQRSYNDQGCNRPEDMGDSRTGLPNY